MKTFKTLILALGVAAAFTSCDKSNSNPEGKWTSAAPVAVTETVAGASSAVKTMTFDFVAPINGGAGEVTYTADYDITASTPAAASDSVVAPYKVTASIKGTWTRDDDNQDEYLLTFDRNSLSVAGVDAPMLGPVTDAFLSSLAQFTSIEDVEVSKDGTHMSFETDNPDAKYQFVKN